MRHFFEKKTTIILTVVIALVLAAVAILMFFILRKPDITKSQNLEYEMGSNIFLSDLLQDDKKEMLVTRDRLIDLSTAGEHSVSFTVKNDFGVNYTVTVSYLSKDTTPPEILLNKTDFVLPFGGFNSGKFNPLSAVKEVKDNSQGEIDFTFTGQVDENVPGQYSIEFVAVDENQNETKASIRVTVENCPYSIDEDGDFSLVDGSYTTQNKKTLKIENGIATVDGIMIVNKSYSIPSDYAKGLDSEAYSAYLKMKAAAKKDGIELPYDNAYRSYGTQQYLYNGYVRNNSKEVADTFSARPGFSEHQTGLAFDIVFASTDEIPLHLEEIEWLKSNAYKYGFVMRYPENKQDITGYLYEPWHYRYVGYNLSKTLYNNGEWITLEEYFGVDSTYKF